MMMMTMTSRQMFTSSTLVISLAVLPIKTVFSLAEWNPMISCKDITADGETFKACASYELYGPSPWEKEDPDGNIESGYSGGWSHFFTIYNSAAENLQEGLDEIPMDAATDIKVRVERDDFNVCKVTVTTTIGEDGPTVDKLCNSCSYCGDPDQPVQEQMGCIYCGTYSADCTNVEHGRKVQCESVETVFFPFTQEALPPESVMEDGGFETTYCRCEGPSEYPSDTPMDGNGFYIVNGITVIPLGHDICKKQSTTDGSGGGMMMMNGMNMMMMARRQPRRFVCPRL
jgi:hypothetical protein